ncbi:hypothetical protein [Candidatus Tisiphia endosymbiont of Ceraclea dissimilis]|uniref:hypothetical protein n=1 Tax=Candidatus Tisiphia endosymbiont of Ceraclea dissimilis TaxID=3077928 RepID=UPI003CCB0795
MFDKAMVIRYLINKYLIFNFLQRNVSNNPGLVKISDQPFNSMVLFNGSRRILTAMVS